MTSPTAIRSEWDVAETTSARIIRVATELFAEHGFHGTGIQQISEASGLGRGALYHHIKSKDNLFYEVLRAPYEEVITEACALLEAGGTPEQKLRKLTRSHVRALIEKRAAWIVNAQDLDALSDEHRAELTRLRHRYQNLWRDVFRECERSGSTNPIDDIQLRGFLGMLSQAFNWLDAKGPKSPEEIADIYLDLLRKGLEPR